MMALVIDICLLLRLFGPAHRGEVCCSRGCRRRGVRAEGNRVVARGGGGGGGGRLGGGKLMRLSRGLLGGLTVS
jgi:hypothetical protein